MRLTERGEHVIGTLTARGHVVIGSQTDTGRLVFPVVVPPEPPPPTPIVTSEVLGAARWIRPRRTRRIERVHGVATLMLGAFGTARLRSVAEGGAAIALTVTGRARSVARVHGQVGVWLAARAEARLIAGDSADELMLLGLDEEEIG